jgi:isochorismate hydrolase
LDLTPPPFCCCCFFFFSFVQRLAWVAAEAGKLQEEVTRAQADVITVRARTAQVEETVQEKAALLEDARGKEVEADERASAL